MVKNKVFVVCGILKYFVFLLIFACIKYISLVFTYLNVVKLDYSCVPSPCRILACINKNIYSKHGNRTSKMKVIPIFGLLRCLPNHVELTVTRVPHKIKSLIPNIGGIEILRGRSDQGRLDRNQTVCIQITHKYFLPLLQNSVEFLQIELTYQILNLGTMITMTGLLGERRG